MKRILPFQQIHFYLCALIAFFLPVYVRAVPLLIVLLIINWIAEGEFKEKISNLKSNKLAFVFISYYLLFLIGMFWTENKNAGAFDLQVKFSLLIFPLLFGSSEHYIDKKSIKTIFIAFVLGCFIETVICFSHSIYIWLTQHEDNFTYTKLSIYLHPSYLSMYLSFAMAILILFLNSDESVTGKVYADVMLIIWFWFSIIMLQSKAGILITGILFVLFFFTMITSKKKMATALIAIIFLTGMYFLTNQYIITTDYSRINIAEHTIVKGKLDTTSKESNQVRILIWEAASEIIRNNFLLGAGTGDAKDELMKKYKEKGMTGALEHKLNAHNQFIQTFIALGIAGILGLLSLFVTGAWKGIKQKKWIYIYFLIIIFFNFIPESMLEVQAGTIFYAFFNSLLLFSNKQS